MRNVFYTTTLIFMVFVVISGCKTSIGPKDKSGIQPQSLSAEPSPGMSVHEAALNGQTGQVMSLLGSGIPVDTLDIEGRTPLMYASFNGYTELIKKLLDKGANVNLQDSYGRTALMMSSSGPYQESVKLLLDKYADPNITDKEEHFTALMYAASEGQLEVVKLLLAGNADPLLKDVDGDDAMTFAQKNGHREVYVLLRSLKNGF